MLHGTTCCTRCTLRCRRAPHVPARVARVAHAPLPSVTSFWPGSWLRSYPCSPAPTPRSGCYCSSCSSAPHAVLSPLYLHDIRIPVKPCLAMVLVSATASSQRLPLTLWHCDQAGSFSTVPMRRRAAVPQRGLIGSRVPHESISAGVVEHPFSPPSRRSLRFSST